MCWPTSHPRRGVSLASRRHFRAARIVWTFNAKAEKRRRQSKFRQMSRIEKEQKLVVLLVNQIAGHQPKRRALLRTQPLIDPPVIQPDGARHSRTPLCAKLAGAQRRRRREAGRHLEPPDVSFPPRVRFSPRVQPALSTAAVSTHYRLITGCSRSEPTHSLGRCVFTPLSRRRGKQGRGSREMRLVPVFAAIWPTTEASATHRRGTCWRIPLLEASFVFEPQWR